MVAPVKQRIWVLVPEVGLNDKLQISHYSFGHKRLNQRFINQIFVDPVEIYMSDAPSIFCSGPCQ